jgi:iron complex transport system ATP-binding protein
VVLLAKGRVCRDGPKREVLTGAALQELFGIPVEILERDSYFHVL